MRKKTPRGSKTGDGLVILDRLTGDDPKMRAALADQWINFEVGQVIYDARTQAGLTQIQLARRMGTTQSVISRLEGADYGAQSLTMLRRIARALDLNLRISFEPARNGRRRA